MVLTICEEPVLNTTQSLTASCGLEELPTEFGRLTQLTWLDLSSNSLKVLPTEFGQLTQLTWLNLHPDSFDEEDHLNVLPTEFGQLTQLNWLDLAENDLEELPTEIGRLTQLSWLDLHWNSINVLPTEFGQLTLLTTLDLWSNSLQVLPTEFGKLTKLISLDLMWNTGFEELPTEFGQLTQLSWLNVSVTELKTIPTEFGRLTRLTQLILYSGSFKALPTEFGQLTQLTTLDLNWNILEALPSEFGQLTQLTTLDLTGNILNALPIEFGRLSQLTSLDLSGNILKALPIELGQLTQLASLSLGSNSFEALPTEFGQLIRLSWLGLAVTSLNALPSEFGKLTQLAQLDLTGSSLNALPSEFGQLTRLTRLDLTRSSLNALPSEFGQLMQLRWLELDENNLEELPAEFGQLTQLTFLNLGGMWTGNSGFQRRSLGTLPLEFGKLTQLTWLNVSSTSLKELPTEFGKLTQLTTLDLEKTSLKVLPTEFGHLIQLTTLDLGESSLKELPAEFGQLTQLTTLDLEGNNLEALPTEFGRLYQLSTLDIGSNNLKELPTEFGNLYELSTLDIGRNNLKALPTEFGRLIGLTTLDLEGNSIEVLPFPPQNIAVSFVSSSKIELTWFPPVVPITAFEYEARLTSSGTTLYVSRIGRSVVAINLLQRFPNVAASQTTFTVQVKALFEGGYGSQYTKPLNVTTCPASMERENTNEVEMCYALAGFYRTKDGSARSCTSLEGDLPPGAIGECLKARLGIEDLTIHEGFWRASLSSEMIQLCPNIEFCTQRSSNVSLDSPDRYCTENHARTYCSDCVENYVLGAEGCAFCTQEARESKKQLGWLVFTLILLFCLLYIYVLYSAGCFKKNKICCKHVARRRNSRQTSGWKQGCNRLSGKVLIWTKVRILFGYFQVLSSYRRTFLKQSLTESSDLLGVMAFLSNVDLTWLVGNAAFRCFYDYNHYDVLLAATLGPIVFTVLLFVCTTGTAYCIVPKLVKRVRDHTESAVLLMLFVVYPYVSQTVFGTFWCENFPDADRRFNLTTSALRADYRLSCEHNMDPERLGFEIYAGVMVLVYPVGVVALYSWVLYVYKERIIAFGNRATAKENREKLTKVSFLIKPYKVKRFWFEAYELIRKLTQTSFVGFLAGLPVERQLPAYLASISETLTVIFVLGLALLRPYTHQSDFAFAVISLLLLIPASQYSLLDPYARHEGISEYGLEALVITELCVFALFVVFEIGRAMSITRVKDGSCVSRCLERGENFDGRSSPSKIDEKVNEELPLVAEKKRIVELEASLEFFKSENQRLRDERVSMLQRTTDPQDTTIQPL